MIRRAWPLALALGACHDDVPRPAVTAPADARMPVLAPVEAAAPPDAPSLPAPATAIGSDEAALVVAPPAAVVVGRSARATISVTPAGAYHVNTAFPVRLALVPPDGIDLPHADLAGSDALAFDAQHLTFGVDLTPRAPGHYRVTGRLKLALCRGEVCLGRDQPIAIELVAAAPPP